jgi:hypothetical protein
MEYLNQIKNIGNKRRHLMHKKLTLEHQLLKVKSEMESLDKKENELFKANQAEPGVNEKEIDDEYDDRYAEDCFLRKRKTKKIGKGFTLKHSIRNKFDSAGESKKRDKELRACKKSERVLCDKFKSRDVEDSLKKEEIIDMRYQMKEQVSNNIIFVDTVKDDELRIPTILQNFKSGCGNYSSDEDDDKYTEYVQQVEDYIIEMEYKKIDDQRLISEYISSMGVEFINDLRYDWNIMIDHCLCGSCWNEYLLERAIDKNDRVFESECGYGGCSCH